MNNSLNKEKSTIDKLFKNLGIKEYENNALNCLNEFIDLYITNILKDAKKNMIISKREKISVEDIELAINKNQNNMFNNRAKIPEMKFLANKVNIIDLPQIPENPVVLKPPINNNLLRNNFQIYSDILNKQLLENKNIYNNNPFENDGISLLGNKRNNDELNDKINKSNNKKEQKNKGKKLMNQELRKLSKESKRFNLIDNNIKENKKVKNLKIKNVSINSDDLNSKEDEFDSDNDDEIENINIGDSKFNKKEEGDIEENSDSVLEESEENENMDNNEFNESSYSKNNNEEENSRDKFL
jgi:histone H3/H4